MPAIAICRLPASSNSTSQGLRSETDVGLVDGQAEGQALSSHDAIARNRRHRALSQIGDAYGVTVDIGDVEQVASQRQALRLVKCGALKAAVIFSREPTSR